jgi:hypothetical protein
LAVFYHFSVVTWVNTMQILVVFDRREMKPEVVLAARWRHRAYLKSPIDSPTTISKSRSFDLSSIAHRLVLGDVYCYNLRRSSFGR